MTMVTSSRAPGRSESRPRVTWVHSGGRSATVIEISSTTEPRFWTATDADVVAPGWMGSFGELTVTRRNWRDSSTGAIGCTGPVPLPPVAKPELKPPTGAVGATGTGGGWGAAGAVAR